MLLYYAVGGGLGHITRALAVQHTLGLGSMSVMTAQDTIQHPAFVRRIHPILLPKHLARDKTAYQHWLQEGLSHWKPHRIILDTFPGGIMGEWCHSALPRVRFDHIARYVKWPEYRLNANCRHWPTFTRTWVIEPLHPQQDIQLNKLSSGLRPLVLQDPNIEVSADERRMIERVKQGVYWLIVHSGSAAEILALLAYAQEHRKHERSDAPIFIATSTALLNIPAEKVLKLYPASPLFSAAKRIYTGGGINIMRQLRGYAEKHYPIPFDRTYDDQYHRIAQWRNQQPVPEVL